MANRRPIRTAPPARWRWRRGKRLPRRWLDGNSSRQTELGCGQEVFDLGCDPASPLRTLFYGDTDWDWADSSEVLVDGIIGRFHWDALSLTTQAGELIWHPQTIRLGVLAVEDSDVPPTIDLFDNEVREEFEWMYLYSAIGNISAVWDPNMDNHVRTQYEDIDVNIRTRRKLGKKDGIYLYGQTRLHSDTVITDTTFRLPVLSTDLRAIIKSK